MRGDAAWRRRISSGGTSWRRLARRCLLLAVVVSAGAPFVRFAARLLPARGVRELALPRVWPDCPAAPPPPPVRVEEGEHDGQGSDALSAWAAAAALRSAAAPQPLRLALLSTYPPTHCGLATFSVALRRGMLSAAAAAGTRLSVDVVAVHTGARGSPRPDYPPEVRGAQQQQQRQRAPHRVSVACLRHRNITHACVPHVQVVRVIRKSVAADYADAAAFIDTQARLCTHETYTRAHPRVAAPDAPHCV